MNHRQYSFISSFFFQNPIDQPNLNILTQIQDLQKQLEKDKVELASLAVNKEKDQNRNQGGMDAGNNNSHPIENQTQFLENIQQLIQNAKGLVPSKDPRSNDDRQVRNWFLFPDFSLCNFLVISQNSFSWILVFWQAFLAFVYRLVASLE